MTPLKHAESTARKWGGHWQDYIAIHDWFDETKVHTGDWTHRALRHHSAGVQWAVEKFGHAVVNSCNQTIAVKLIAEQHLMEDCGFIPTPKDWLKCLGAHPEPWMLKVGKVYQTQGLSITPTIDGLKVAVR
jgi:hypothetical protein